MSSDRRNGHNEADFHTGRLIHIHRSTSIDSSENVLQMNPSRQPYQQNYESHNTYQVKNPRDSYSSRNLHSEEVNQYRYDEKYATSYNEIERPQYIQQWGKPTHQPPAYQPYPTARPPYHQLQSVVTKSFSVDEDRDDQHPIRSDYRGHTHTFKMSQNANYMNSQSLDEREEERFPRMEAIREERDPVEREAPVFHVQPSSSDSAHMIPPSPSDKKPGNENTTDVSQDQGLLKRSFWHHSMPNEKNSSPINHPAFLPPKRLKRPEMHKKHEPVTLVAKKSPEHPHHDYQKNTQFSWAHRSHSWGSGYPESNRHNEVRKTQSFPAAWSSSPPHGAPAQYRYGESREGPERTTRKHFPFVQGEQLLPHFDGAAQPNDHQSNGLPPQNFFRPGSFDSGGDSRRSSFDQGEGRGGEWNQSCGTAFRSRHTSPQHHAGVSPSYNGPAYAPCPDDRNDQENSMRTFSRDDNESREGVAYSRESFNNREAARDSSPRGFSSNRLQPVYGVAVPSIRADFNPPPPPQECNTQISKTEASTEVVIRSQSLTRNVSDVSTGAERDAHPVKSNEKLCLLAQEDDRISLSETLCTIRANIEVFTATVPDVEAPAPGRKHPVTIGQVGLRCIHCRHTTKSSDRVKRAVCYPSSIKRIYRTVIDMKLDHFQHCPFVPMSLKKRLDELKAINTRSTGTTMQYFAKAAKKMGMVDAESGVRMKIENEDVAPGSPLGSDFKAMKIVSPTSGGIKDCSSPQRGSHPQQNKSDDVDSNCPQQNSSNSVGTDAQSTEKDSKVSGFLGNIILSLPDDNKALSPLRCFLRENVCAFTATEEDIAVRTPTTFSVVKGQVGVGCIHCYSLPAKERSNRAVCFPFSIGRIYQSVADIQRFHLGECKMVPPDIRDKFLELQSASSKGSKGLATRQYWVTSAKKIGLIDTQQGIRFGRDPSKPAAPAISLDILAQVASNVTTSDRPLVHPEDKPNIAEFLYVVMEQLQPCRFTEADRNKRRVKDVGCIGVECKHCAGQVESRKFFWSSVNAVESNFVSVHTHMMECRRIPDSLKSRLAELKQLRKEQTGRLKTGSQKAFFARVWARLHGDEAPGPIPKSSLHSGPNNGKDKHKQVEAVSV